jgi:hypothetical protein
MQAGNFKKIIKQAKKKLQAMVKKIKTTDPPAEGKINQLTSVVFSGEGVMDRDPVFWGVVVAFNKVETDSLFLLFLVKKRSFPTHSREIEKIISSIKAIKRK